LSLIEFIGYIPAIVFPTATIIQLLHLYKIKSSEGVSPITWGAFALGNVSLYTYTEKYSELQSIVGLLVTAILQLCIIILVFKYRKNRKFNGHSTNK
jgi:uncharacterized protein with PQ loop repeat